MSKCGTPFKGGTCTAENSSEVHGHYSDFTIKETPIKHCKIYNEGAPVVHIDETAVVCCLVTTIGSFDVHGCGCTTGDHCCAVSHGIICSTEDKKAP